MLVWGRSTVSFIIGEASFIRRVLFRANVINRLRVHKCKVIDKRGGTFDRVPDLYIHRVFIGRDNLHVSESHFLWEERGDACVKADKVILSNHTWPQSIFKLCRY